MRIHSTKVKRIPIRIMNAMENNLVHDCFAPVVTSWTVINSAFIELKRAVIEKIYNIIVFTAERIIKRLHVNMNMLIYLMQYLYGSNKEQPLIQVCSWLVERQMDIINIIRQVRQEYKNEIGHLNIAYVFTLL